MRLNRKLALAGLVALATASFGARAEVRGLILAIADYPGPAALPGVKKDVALAKRLAQWMRVPERSLVILQDGGLNLEGFRQTLQNFANSVRPGDEIFLYYSGHGGRMEISRTGPTPQCAESFVAADLKFFMDKDFKSWLEGISSKASKVVVFADSCHSGGLADEKAKTATRSVNKDLRPKFFAPKAELSPSGGTCEPVNLAKAVVMTRTLRSNSAYIAAARDNEVAWSTSRGSSASMAWVTCLESPTTDKDGSGSISVEELRECGQEWLGRNNFNQHLHVVGNTQMVLGFGTTAASTSMPAPVIPAPSAQPAPQPVVATPPPSPVAALRTMLDELVANADPKRQVTVTPIRDRVVIGRDPVEFDLVTRDPGYLYLLHQGSDGKTVDLLFPNKLDQDNYVAAGKHRFPRPAWRITAGGPPGSDRIVAIVSPMRRDFGRVAAGELGPFSLLADSSKLGAGSTRNLMIESLRPATPAAGDCTTRNLNIVANQRDCVSAYGAAVTQIHEEN